MALESVHRSENSTARSKYNVEQITSYPFKAESIKQVCYFRMDSSTSDSKLKLNQLDGSLFTHLILSSARINTEGELVVARESDYECLNGVAALKGKYPQLRIMISIANDEHNAFSRLTLPQHSHQQLHEPFNNSTSGNNKSQVSNLSANELRSRMAKSAMEFLDRFHLDGLDLDWQFPNFPATILNLRDHERTGFTKILTSLRSAIVENFYARQSDSQQHLLSSLYQNKRRDGSANPAGNVEPYLLSATVAGQESVWRGSYELRQLVNLCDWLNVMSFDYFLFKSYAPFTGPIAPLHSIVEPFVPIFNKFSLSWTASKLVNEELLPRDKIVMGIPTYGRAYRLVFRQNQATVFNLALGVLRSAQHSGECLNYGEILEILRRPDTLVEYDERAQVPYLLTDSGCTWISYENERSVRAKVEFILSNKLAGYMTWDLNSDAHSMCNNQGQSNGIEIESELSNFPLQKAMQAAARQFSKCS